MRNSDIGLVTGLLVVASLSALAACEQKPPPPVKYSAAEEAAEYVKHSCDQFGRAIYRYTGTGLFVIDDAEECSKEKKIEKESMQ